MKEEIRSEIKSVAKKVLLDVNCDFEETVTDIFDKIKVNFISSKENYQIILNELSRHRTTELKYQYLYKTISELKERRYKSDALRILEFVRERSLSEIKPPLGTIYQTSIFERFHRMMSKSIRQLQYGPTKIRDLNPFLENETFLKDVYVDYLEGFNNRLSTYFDKDKLNQLIIEFTESELDLLAYLNDGSDMANLVRYDYMIDEIEELFKGDFYNTMKEYAEVTIIKVHLAIYILLTEMDIENFCNEEIKKLDHSKPSNENQLEKKRPKKIKWLGTPAEFGAIMKKLYENGFIAKTKDTKTTASFLNDFFEIKDSKGKNVEPTHLYKCFGEKEKRYPPQIFKIPFSDNYKKDQ